MKTMRTRTKRKRPAPTNRRSCASRTKISLVAVVPPHDYLIAALQPGKFVFSDPKRVLQHYRHLADVSLLPNVRFAPEAAVPKKSAFGATSPKFARLVRRKLSQCSGLGQE